MEARKACGVLVARNLTGGIMVSRSVLRTAVLSLVGLLGSAAAFAQNAATGATAARIGTINVLEAISATAEGKQGAAQLDAQFAPQQKELETLEKQVNDLQQRLNAGESKLSDEERARITAQGTKLAQRLDRKKNEYQEDINAAQREIVDGIGRRLIVVIDRYAQEHRYVMIFDSSAQNSQMLYASKNIDLTQEIVHLYDQGNPVKGAIASPTKKPAAATKPVTPPAPKPQ
jgi:Skp family chaperone for outer membrane proteins